MSYDDVFNSRYGPRTARGGIKAQSTRGSFGKNWWAQRWVNVIEALDLGGRLARGRVYARRGQVLSIDIKEGAIAAQVQGSRAMPYKVKIQVRTIPMEKWIALSRTVFNQALVAAKLLAGEMPQDIEKLFVKEKLSLFPKNMDEFVTDCSCPDYSNPCKHIASVYYLLGEEFDRDPFLIFRMRGLSKDKLLDLITGVDRNLPLGESKNARSDRVLGTESEVTAKKSVRSRSAKKAPELPLEEFWKWPRSSFDGHYNLEDKCTIPALRPLTPPTSNAALPKRLGNLSFWRSDYPFIPTLEQVYRTATENAMNSLAKPLFSDKQDK